MKKEEGAEEAAPVSAPAEAGSGPENADQVRALPTFPLLALLLPGRARKPRPLGAGRCPACIVGYACHSTAGAFASQSSKLSETECHARAVCSQAALAEKAATEAQEKIDAQALPIRTYLDQTVVPILLQGLSDLVKQRFERVRMRS